MKQLLLMVLFALTGICANAQFKVGDIYDRNGLKGLVVDVDESGNHGLILSLEESDKDWLADKAHSMNTNAFFEEDGMKNMEAIETYISENNLSWDTFPLFAWARGLGDGWYIPSRGELNTIWKNLNGGNLDFNKKANKLWKGYDKAVKKAGGDSFFCSNGSTMVFKMLAGMISSTEAEGGKVYTINTEKGKNLVNHPMAAPNVKIIEYTLNKDAHRSEGDALGFKRILHFDARAVHKF
ncbi:MAG: hypothetical protein NC342_00455 [Pseudoflavonifractor sp.]|nr:hypothetical protein [Alloprevotella sp.]MCM1115997.1 hypothetical protein [Pseudoflavonifractor sp.]